MIRVLLRQYDKFCVRLDELGLLEEEDIEIVTKEGSALDVLMAVKQYEVDVVVISDANENKGLTSHLLAEFPDVTLMILGSDGGVQFEQRCSHRWTVSLIEKARMAEALRFVVGSPCELFES